MAKIPANLANSITSYYGILELVGFLAQHPKDEYVYGEGEGAFTLSNQDIREIVDDFQRDNVLTPDQVKVETADATTFRTLYAKLLTLGPEKQSSIPDKESRDIIYRAYQDHQKELTQTATPKTSSKTIGESVRATEKYWRTKQLLSSSITRALSPYMESSETSGVYATQMHDRLVAELAPQLEDIDTSDPVRAKAQTRAIIEQGIRNSSSWKQLENLVVSEGKNFENTKDSLTALLNKEKIVKVETDANASKIESIRRSYGPTPSEAKAELEQTLNTWQKNAGVGRNEVNELGNDVVTALQKAVIETVSEPSIWDRFGKQEDLRVKAFRKALGDELVSKYNLTKVDKDRLIEAALQSPSTSAYMNRVMTGLEAPPGDWVEVLGLRPTNLVAYVAKNAGVDPLVVSLTRHGLSGDQLAKQLLQSGYSEQDITSQLNNLQSFMGNNQGLIGGIYKTRLAYDQALVKIRTALSPVNIPIIRDIFKAYNTVSLNISTAYNGFLNNHRFIAFLISPGHRLNSWAGWINKMAINSNLPNWFRTGLTFYKNGGYTTDGFIGAVKTHYRIKFGSWLVSQGAKVGSEKLSGKFLAWAGTGLVAGTATGGVGFAIQAGLWFMKQAGRAPEAIKNADVIAGWLLQNLVGLSMLIGMAGTTIVGGLIGFAVGAISLFFISFTWPIAIVLGIFTGLGMLAGYLWSQAGSISAGIGSSLSALGANVSSWFTSLFSNSIGTVASATGGLVIGTVLATFTSIFLTMEAIITSKVETKESVGLEDTISSPHIALTKNVLGVFDEGELKMGNSQTNQTLTYTIQVGGVDIPLTNITVNDTATKYQESGQTNVYENSTTIPALAPGETKTITYTIKLNSTFRDSYLTNSVEVTATSENGEEKSVTSKGIIIGTPPVLPSAEFAQRLANAVLACYGSDGKVNQTDFAGDGDGQCLKNLNDPQINLAIPALLESVYGDYSGPFLQCVGFTRAVMNGLGLDLPGRGYAYIYIDEPPEGYTRVSGPPLPGDIFVTPKTPKNGAGHIGIVVGVSELSIIVADANSNGYGITRSTGSIEISRVGAFYRPK